MSRPAVLPVDDADYPRVDYRPLEGTELRFLRYQQLRGRSSSTMSYIGVESPILTEYMAFNKFKDAGYKLVPERDNKSNYQPQKLVGSLARYGQRVDVKSVDRRVLQQAQDLTLKVFGGAGELEPFSLDWELEEFIKPAKSAGLPEFGKKGETFMKDLDRAKRIVHLNRVPDPCVAYHRVQHGPQPGEVGDKGPKTRLVWGYPQSMFILESRFAPKLIQSFLKSESPMAFGLVKGQVSARMLPITNSAYRYCIDFSGFDSSIAAEFIDFAFGVLKTHFRTFTPEEKVTWEKIVTYFIHTPIMMPNASVWQKHHGVPSGSYFTQMVDSLVNYMALCYSWLRFSDSPVPQERILVLGDDAIVGQSKYVKLTQLAGYFTELGLKLNVRKTHVTVPGEEVWFLGHKWINGAPHRSYWEVVVRGAFPEKASAIKDAKMRYALRMLALATDSIEGQLLAQQFAPIRTNDIAVKFASYRDLMHGDARVSTKDRTGYQALLEDEGIIRPVTNYSLTTSQQDLGLWLS
jgi:hypothetical protein